MSAKTALWIVLAGLLAACADAPPPQAAAAPADPVYCYRYLVSVECFDQPVPRDARRRVDTLESRQAP